MSERNKIIAIGSLSAAVVAAIITLIVWLATPHAHTIDVKTIEWRDSRQVITYGYDKSPYWGKFHLKGNGEQAIGNERVSAKIEEYTVSGTESDGAELVSISVPHDIWEKITTADQLNYSQRKIGNPYNAAIAG